MTTALRALLQLVETVELGEELLQLAATVEPTGMRRWSMLFDEASPRHALALALQSHRR